VFYFWRIKFAVVVVVVVVVVTVLTDKAQATETKSHEK